MLVNTGDLRDAWKVRGASECLFALVGLATCVAHYTLYVSVRTDTHSFPIEATVHSCRGREVKGEGERVESKENEREAGVTEWESGRVWKGGERERET